MFHISCMLSGWFAWCLVFISGELVHVMSAVVGLGRDGTLAHWVTHSVGVTHSVRVSPRTPWQAPQRVVVFTPLTLLAWLRARVSPSVVHVDWYTNR